MSALKGKATHIGQAGSQLYCHDHKGTSVDAFGECQEAALSEGLTTASIVVGLTLTSTVMLLTCTSPEFSWDEAYRLPYTSESWRSIWSEYAVSHGPMSVYLAKLGQMILPAGVASVEIRSRFFIALVSSIGIGFMYWMLRCSFKTTAIAALVGSGLLLFSFIRLGETNVIGPHHLMLACTLLFAGLGYHWRETPTPAAAVSLGAVGGLGALSTTYVIPAALCWVIAVSLVGKKWIAWDRAWFKISWAIPIAFITSAGVVIMLWPPGILHYLFLKDFLFLVHFVGHPTLVGDQILPRAPRWAAVYWLIHLEAPLLATFCFVVPAALWKTFKSGQLSSKHAYLLLFLTFFFATAITAHMAGARNLLQVVGVLCLLVGALFDEALGHNRQLTRCSSVLVGLAAILNLVWLCLGSGYVPYLATDGYRAFLDQNESRLSEKAQALVYGLPILEFYAKQYRIPIAWEATEMPWTPSADAPLGAEVKYVLIPEFVYRHMPPEQPMRRVVAEHWKVKWEFRANHVWALRLYEKP